MLKKLWARVRGRTPPDLEPEREHTYPSEFHSPGYHWQQRMIQYMHVCEENKRRDKAARVIQRALWKCVQRRQMFETLDELYRPGGLGALRGKERFEKLIQSYDT